MLPQKMWKKNLIILLIAFKNTKRHRFPSNVTHPTPNLSALVSDRTGPNKLGANVFNRFYLEKKCGPPNSNNKCAHVVDWCLEVELQNSRSNIFATGKFLHACLRSADRKWPQYITLY